MAKDIFEEAREKRLKKQGPYMGDSKEHGREKCICTDFEKVKAVISILKKYENDLSDGFGYYNNDENAVLVDLATDIVKLFK